MELSREAIDQIIIKAKVADKLLVQAAEMADINIKLGIVIDHILMIIEDETGETIVDDL